MTKRPRQRLSIAIWRGWGQFITGCVGGLFSAGAGRSDPGDLS